METEKIKNIVTETLVSILGVKPDEVIETANLQNDLGMDSLDAVELTMKFEQEFNINISDEEAEKIQTVGDILDYLKLNY
jgi:acyl carrier protein